jgi:hypothetical protein
LSAAAGGFWIIGMVGDKSECIETVGESYGIDVMAADEL